MNLGVGIRSGIQVERVPAGSFRYILPNSKSMLRAPSSNIVRLWYQCASVPTTAPPQEKIMYRSRLPSSSPPKKYVKSKSKKESKESRIKNRLYICKNSNEARPSFGMRSIKSLHQPVTTSETLQPPSSAELSLQEISTSEISSLNQPSTSRSKLIDATSICNETADNVIKVLSAQNPSVRSEPINRTKMLNIKFSKPIEFSKREFKKRRSAKLSERYPIEERVKCVEWYFKLGLARKVIENWKEFSSDTPAPSERNVHRYVKRFRKTGGVFDRPQPGTKRTVSTEENKDRVRQAYQNDPTKTMSAIADELDINRGSIKTICKELGIRSHLRDQYWSNVERMRKAYQADPTKSIAEYARELGLRTMSAHGICKRLGIRSTNQVKRSAERQNSGKSETSGKIDSCANSEHLTDASKVPSSSSDPSGLLVGPHGAVQNSFDVPNTSSTSGMRQRIGHMSMDRIDSYLLRHI